MPTVCVFTWLLYAENHYITRSVLRTDKTNATRMWANAQRDGRPAEYRWRPLFNAAKFG